MELSTRPHKTHSSHPIHIIHSITISTSSTIRIWIEQTKQYDTLGLGSELKQILDYCMYYVKLVLYNILSIYNKTIICLMDMSLDSKPISLT